MKRQRRLQTSLRLTEAAELYTVFAHWHATVVGIQSALHQQQVQHMALMQLVQQYENAPRSQAPASHPDSAEMAAQSIGRSSANLADATNELQGSLRVLGSNVMRIVREQPLDARTVVSAPRRILSATRHLFPRLAEHVSPTRCPGLASSCPHPLPAPQSRPTPQPSPFACQRLPFPTGNAPSNPYPASH